MIIYVTLTPSGCPQHEGANINEKFYNLSVAALGLFQTMKQEIKRSLSHSVICFKQKTLVFRDSSLEHVY